MTDSEPTKRARIWSTTIIAIASSLATGAGVHYFDKPREDRNEAQVISDAIRLAIQEEIGPLKDKVNALDSRLLLAEANTTSLRAQIVPRMDQLAVTMQDIASSMSQTGKDVAYMRGKLEQKSGS